MIPQPTNLAEKLGALFCADMSVLLPSSICVGCGCVEKRSEGPLISDLHRKRTDLSDQAAALCQLQIVTCPVVWAGANHAVPVPPIGLRGNGTLAHEKPKTSKRTVPGIDFQELRTEITMQQVLHLVGFAPTRRSGDQWYGRCPVHDAPSRRNRSFSVNVAIGRYYCHQCHSRGNQLDLWAAITTMPLYEASIDLCRALGREVPWMHRS